MKRFVLHICLFLLLPATVWAQVEKHVEVTKDYVPDLAPALKLSFEPSMIDTAVLRPDIDYSITPQALAARLDVEPIRPATVTYWEFNRHRPLYLKLGAGWPFNTLGDLYVTTQHPGTGYLSGYANHEGIYADLRNRFGVETPAGRMLNRVGVAAGKYFGRRTLEGEVAYEHRRYRRYGGIDVPGAHVPVIGYGEMGVGVRFGDDFRDLSRLNFDIGLRGALFDDYSERMTEGAQRGRQTHLGVDAALARRFDRHLFRLALRYEHGAGQKSLSDYRQDLLAAEARYGYRGGAVDFELGADYRYDKRAHAAGRHYVTPYLRMRFDTGAKGFSPLIEADGTLCDNSFRTLSRLNPYVEPGVWCDRSTVEYAFRLGADGATANDRFAYRIFVGAAVRENQLFWTVGTAPVGRLLPVQARQTLFTIDGEAEYRPAERFRMTLGLRGSLYDDHSPYECGLPAFEGRFEARYAVRKVSFGASVAARSERRWSFVGESEAGPVPSGEVFVAPFVCDVRADIDWRITRAFALFAEARNLAGCALYEQPLYRGYGVRFTAGVRLEF